MKLPMTGPVVTVPGFNHENPLLRVILDHIRTRIQSKFQSLRVVRKFSEKIKYESFKRLAVCTLLGAKFPARRERERKRYKKEKEAYGDQIGIFMGGKQRILHNPRRRSAVDIGSCKVKEPISQQISGQSPVVHLVNNDKIPSRISSQSHKIY